MSFESMVAAFADRFLSDRSFELIVAPALADLHFDPGAGRFRRAVNRLAVLSAVAGGLRDDVSRDSGSFVSLTLMPTCYYTFQLAICFDYFSTWSDLLTAFMVILALSVVPVMVCFWPSRRPARLSEVEPR